MKKEISNKKLIELLDMCSNAAQMVLLTNNVALTAEQLLRLLIHIMKEDSSFDLNTILNVLIHNDITCEQIQKEDWSYEQNEELVKKYVCKCITFVNTHYYKTLTEYVESFVLEEQQNT